MKETFIAVLDGALPSLGYGDRSSFIRDAILEKMERDGVQNPDTKPLDSALASSPTRMGKGGRPTHQAVLNEKPSGRKAVSSKPVSGAAKALKKAEESDRRR
jgi:hypothetical protein